VGLLLILNDISDMLYKIKLFRWFCFCSSAVPRDVNEDRLCFDSSLQRDEWPWIGR